MQYKQRSNVDRKARLQIPAQPILKRDPILRRCEWHEVTLGFQDLESAQIEATRCIQCPGAPCIKACPVHNDIPGALWEIEQGNLIQAGELFRLTSPMPDICGRICPQERLCEGSCVVGNQKRVPPVAPVAIGRLEALAGDHQRLAEGVPPIRPKGNSGRRIAVAGSGPAGLTVAELLSRAGHKVVVYEAWPRPGGILLYGIPNFKLDKSIPRSKIDQLEMLGVEFVCDTRIGTAITVEGLLAGGFDAVYLGNGAGTGATLNIPGERLGNIFQATEFLVRGNVPIDERPERLRGAMTTGPQTVIIGGGDTAMDCVRTAVRLLHQQRGGEGMVTCLYRRSEDEMPGREEERRHAVEEGVEFRYLTAPVRFLGDDREQVVAVECVTMDLQEPDASGRRRPVPVPGSEYLIDADTVVLAVGYWGDEEFAGAIPGVAHKRGLYVVDPETGMTNVAGVFAGGDNVHGADLVVTAIAEAKTAARGIMQYLASRAPVG